MTEKVKRLEGYDAVIAGAGTAGCVLAKDLAVKGKKVIVIERGGAGRKFLGSPYAMMLGGHVEGGLPKSLWVSTIEGDNVLVGKGLGGGSKTYAGGCFMPNFEMWAKWGVDLKPYLEGAKKDTWCSETPDEFLGPGAKRLMEASDKAGYPFGKMMKHTDWNKCRVGCSMCMSGCKYGAKWEGKYAAEEAIEHGATFLYNLNVEDVILKDGVAVGLRARDAGGQIYEIRGKIIISSSGGSGSSVIFSKSGLAKAGSWFTGDPSILAFGFLPKGVEGSGREVQFTAFYEDKENKCVFGAAGMTPGFLWRMNNLTNEGLGSVKDWGRYHQNLCIFCKMHDDDQGQVLIDGKMSKVYTQEDLLRQNYARAVTRQILIAAGCSPDDIHYSPTILGHPSGTIKIGQLLDANCESLDIKNLYACDTSVFPEAPGMPPVLTLICLAKRLAAYLLGEKPILPEAEAIIRARERVTAQVVKSSTHES